MKKKLSDADLALLASRGKVVNGFTTSTDFEILSWDKPKTKKAKKRTTKKANPNSNHPLVGKMLHTSWGYDMTINEFCKIIEVSATGKTAKCRMLGKKGFNGFSGSVRAGKTVFGPEFRVKINPNGEYFNGSYPYICNETKEESSFKMGYWGLYNGGDVYENHMD